MAPESPWLTTLRGFARYGDRIAVASRGRTLTYAQLAAQADAVRAAVIEAGAKPGEPVAIFVQNGPEVVVASYGVMASGAAEFVIDLNIGSFEFAYGLEIIGVRRIIVERGRSEHMSAHGLQVLILEDILARPPAAVASPPFDPRAWGKANLTSGTTGLPKGIIHRHDRRWYAHVLLRSHLPFTPGANDRVLLMTSYAHGAALLMAAWLESGASVELIDGVDIAYIDKLFGRGELTAVFAPPTVLTKLVQGTNHTRIDGIKCVFCGTATLQPALYHAAAKLFGPVIRVTYGKSEMFNPITVLEMEDAADYYRDLTELNAVCLGAPAAGVEVVIRDEAGSICDSDEDGEIHLRSPHMMIGHVDEHGFHELPEGEFHATGDLGYLDERGRLFLAGRAHDVIKTGGYKVYPEEIERVLPPGIAVIGIPSDYWGEVIVAVSEKEGIGEIVAAATAGLPRYKQPRACVTVDILQTNLQGKLRRSLQRDVVLQRYMLVDGPYPALVPLRHFWVTIEGDPCAPLGYGVTASSEEDVRAVLRDYVFGRDPLPALSIAADIDMSSLDTERVVPGMDDPIGRGIWFPFGFDARALDARPIKRFERRDGKEYLLLIRRDDGLFTFAGACETYDEDIGTHWGSPGRGGFGLYQSAELAERDAMTAVPWLRDPDWDPNEKI